jgi:hypothetical protein
LSEVSDVIAFYVIFFGLCCVQKVEYQDILSPTSDSPMMFFILDPKPWDFVKFEHVAYSSQVFRNHLFEACFLRNRGTRRGKCIPLYGTASLCVLFIITPLKDLGDVRITLYIQQKDPIYSRVRLTVFRGRRQAG